MDPVTFIHNGKAFTMTQEEIEAAYEYQKRQFLLSDAEDHLRAMCFGWEYKDDYDPESGWATEKQDACLEAFEEDYGIPFDEALRHLEAYAIRFQSGFDQDLTEDDQWDYAVSAVLRDFKEAEMPENRK